MKVLFDTSVLVAAHVPSHAEYSSARLWLERAKQGAFEFVVAAHTLMETYSVLTRLPLKPRIMPATAFHFLETNVLATARVVALTAEDYRDLLTSLAATGTGGGIVYDSLLVKAAELVKYGVFAMPMPPSLTTTRMRFSETSRSRKNGAVVNTFSLPTTRLRRIRHHSRPGPQFRLLVTTNHCRRQSFSVRPLRKVLFDCVAKKGRHRCLNPS